MRIIGFLVLSIFAVTYAEVNDIVDLSVRNGHVRLRTARNGGLKAVIHLATRGLNYTDPKYNETKAVAEMEGLLWGAYHFGVGRKSGEEQANHFLRTVGNTEKVLLALNLESNAIGADMSVKEAIDFVKTVKEKTNRYPIIFGPKSFVEKYNMETVRNCHLWIVQYIHGMNPNLPAGWNDWVLWQYTDGTVGGSPRHIPGIGTCNRNRYKGTLEQLKTKWPNL